MSIVTLDPVREDFELRPTPATPREQNTIMLRLCLARAVLALRDNNPVALGTPDQRSQFLDTCRELIDESERLERGEIAHD